MPHRSRAAATGVLIAMLVAGCSSGGPASPSPSPVSGSPSPSPSPTATPFDLAGAFLEQIVDPSFAATMKIGGEYRLGGLQVALTGDGALRGPDSRVRLEIDIPGAPVESETIELGSTSWARDGDGPWIEKASYAGSSDDGLSDLLGDLLRVEDVGVEDRNGRRLHRLEPPHGFEVPASAFGLDDPTMTDVSTGLSLFAEADGTPAAIDISIDWRQPFGADVVDAGMNLEMTLDQVGRSIAVEPPNDPWVRVTPADGAFSVAYPAAWSAEEVDDAIEISVDGGLIVWIGTFDAGDATIDDMVAELTAQLTATFVDPSVDGVEERTVARWPAATLRMHGTTEAGDRLHVIETIVLADDGRAWEITYSGLEGYEADDLSFVEDLLSTLEIEAPTG